MSISKSYNKQNGVTYVYEVIENYWDKEKKQARSKRKLIGKIDPVTGEIVPTASKGRSKKTENTEDYKSMYEKAQKELAAKERRIAELEEMLHNYLTSEVVALRDAQSSLKKRCDAADALLHRIG